MKRPISNRLWYIAPGLTHQNKKVPCFVGQKSQKTAIFIEFGGFSIDNLLKTENVNSLATKPLKNKGF